MTAHRLSGALLKLDRAERHLAEFDHEAGRYLRSEPIHVETKTEALGGRRRRIVWAASATDDPPDVLGAIVGDWAQSTRAALDYVVYELVRKATGVEDPRSTQFPVATTRGDYRSAQRRLDGVPAWARDVFEGLQPFNDADEAEFHPLAILVDISNRDKHRLVHTTALQVAGSQARLEGISFVRLYGIRQSPGTIAAERIILDVDAELDGDDIRIAMDLQFTVGIEGYELPAGALMHTIAFEARSIVEWFAPALDEAGAAT